LKTKNNRNVLGQTPVNDQLVICLAHTANQCTFTQSTQPITQQNMPFSSLSMHSNFNDMTKTITTSSNCCQLKSYNNAINAERVLTGFIPVYDVIAAMFLGHQQLLNLRGIHYTLQWQYY